MPDKVVVGVRPKSFRFRGWERGVVPVYPSYCQLVKK